MLLTHAGAAVIALALAAETIGIIRDRPGGEPPGPEGEAPAQAEPARPSGEAQLDQAPLESEPLGAELRDMTPELAELYGSLVQRGALVASVAPKGPAARAGLRRGDVIIGLQGAPVADAEVLAQRIDVVPPGRSVTVDLVREGVTRSRQVRLPRGAARLNSR